MSDTITTVATMKKLEIIIKPGKLDAVKKAMATAGYTGVTISQVEGHGNQKGLSQNGGGLKLELLPKIRLEIVVSDADLETLVKAIVKAAQSGQHGDGKIFVIPLDEALRIRTGEKGNEAV